MKFILRDLIWLTIVVALALTAWIQRREIAAETDRANSLQKGLEIADAETRIIERYSEIAKRIENAESFQRSLRVQPRDSLQLYPSANVDAREFSHEQFCDALGSFFPQGPTLSGCFYVGEKDGFDYFEIWYEGETKDQFKVLEGAIEKPPAIPWPVAGKYTPIRRMK